MVWFRRTEPEHSTFKFLSNPCPDSGRSDGASVEPSLAPPDSIPPEAINLPPLPKQAPLLAETYPAVTKYLSTFENKSVEIYVVLVEDLYESELGDGKFHYPDCIFLDEATAQEYCSKNKNDNDDYHLRKCRLKLDDAAILCEIFKQSFDHIGGWQVLKLMNEKLDEISP